MTAAKRAKETDSSAERETPLRVVGIDLGTTNSTIAEARWEPGGAVPKAAAELRIIAELVAVLG
jgi:molecular chaperone DnaK (HSP70)